MLLAAAVAAGGEPARADPREVPDPSVDCARTFCGCWRERTLEMATVVPDPAGAGVAGVEVRCEGERGRFAPLVLSAHRVGPTVALEPAARAPAAGGGAHCLGLGRDACWEDAACEAIPYWGESVAPCLPLGRGFSANCPFVGCRPAENDCPSLHELLERCPEYCSYNRFAVDPRTGCRTCRCQ